MKETSKLKDLEQAVQDKAHITHIQGKNLEIISKFINIMNKNTWRQDYFQAGKMKSKIKWKQDKTEMNGITIINNALDVNTVKLLKIWSPFDYKELNKLWKFIALSDIFPSLSHF